MSKQKAEEKELNTIMNEIEKWSKKNDVCFIGSFVSFNEKKMKKNEDGITKDARLGVYGNKNVLKIMLEDIKNEIKKEKSDFVNC